MTEKVFIYSVDTSIRCLCQSDDFETHFFSCPEKLYDTMSICKPAIMVLDYRLLTRIGPEYIQKICRGARHCAIIMLATESSSYFLSFFWECGIRNYVMLPCSKDVLFHKILSLLKESRSSEDMNRLSPGFFPMPEQDGILGSTFGISKLKRQLYNIAKTDTPMLLLGESGTGKTHMAKIIHSISRRERKPFMSVNMAAIPEQLAEAELFGTTEGAFTGSVSRNGYFTAAEGGTLFMDEIGELSPAIQSKLLHVLEENTFAKVGSVKTHKCDVRFLFATNSDLNQMMDKRRFRQDLYYRISTFPLTIPPLRERKDDIPLFAEHFLRPYGKAMSESGLQKLYDHHWPGNIRELKNCLTRACLMTREEMIDAHNISF